MTSDGGCHPSTKSGRNLELVKSARGPRATSCISQRYPELSGLSERTMNYPQQRIVEEVAVGTNAPRVQKRGLTASAHPIDQPRRHPTYPQHIRPSHSRATESERTGPLDGATSRHRLGPRRDRPTIVFADEQHRQRPDLGEVERLHQHPLIERTLTEIRDRHRPGSKVFAAERKSASRRPRRSNDPISEMQAIRCHQMHVSRPTVVQTILVPEQLQQQR